MIGVGYDGDQVVRVQHLDLSFGVEVGKTCVALVMVVVVAVVVSSSLSSSSPPLPVVAVHVLVSRRARALRGEAMPWTRGWRGLLHRDQERRAERRGVFFFL